MKAWIKNMEFKSKNSKDLNSGPKITLQLQPSDVKHHIAQTRCCNSLSKLVTLLKMTRRCNDLDLGIDIEIEQRQKEVIKNLRTRKALYDLRQEDGTYMVTIKVKDLDDMKRIGRAHYYGDIAPACEFEFEYTDNDEWEADLIDAEAGIDDE